MSLAVLVLLVVHLSAWAESAKPRKLNLSQARQLAYRAISDQARKLPGLDFERSKYPDFPDFYIFIVTWRWGRPLEMIPEK
jgi:hypothetical protein